LFLTYSAVVRTGGRRSLVWPVDAMLGQTEIEASTIASSAVGGDPVATRFRNKKAAYKAAS
jgi:hypothetical protein